MSGFKHLYQSQLYQMKILAKKATKAYLASYMDSAEALSVEKVTISLEMIITCQAKLQGKEADKNLENL